MKVRVLGCYGNSTQEYHTTAFLVNDTVLLDAGTTTGVLDDRELLRIRHVLLTHTHMDHIKGLFPLIDQLFMLGKTGIELCSVDQVLRIASEHLFNNLVWPDFTKIPEGGDPVITFKRLDTGEQARIGTLTVTPVEVNHTVHTVGYTLADHGSAFAFTGDTRPTEQFWKAVAGIPEVGFVIAESTFPERFRDLALVSGHMTLSMLIDQLDDHGLGDMAVYVNHIKPLFRKEILEEIRTCGRKTIRALVQGDTLTV